MGSKWNTLITSGAYIGEEMQAEFGRIPPVFLPVGAAFLLQHQLREAEAIRNIWLSLPNDYEMTASQRRLLDERGAHIVHVEPNKSLGLSVFQAILEMGPDLPLEIMHGDTLVLGPPCPDMDAVSVSEVSEQYTWGLVELKDGRIYGVRDEDRSDQISSEAIILTGYFFISDPARFLKSLVARDFSFAGALDAYATEVAVHAIDNITALDFGHLKTYYDSRRSLAAARQFNSLSIEGGVVRKRSQDRRKLDGEANWLRSVPAALQPFTARLIEDLDAPVSGEYRTIYSCYPTLAELYLARAPKVLWGKVLNSCMEYLVKATSYTVPNGEHHFDWLVAGKLRERIQHYPEFLPAPDEDLTINGDSVGTLADIVGELSLVVQGAPALPSCVMHGDFCFSNILYDLRSDRILLIDPRGLIADEITIYGDVRYDIAKLGHSIVGRYDQIMAENIHSAGSRADFLIDIPTDPIRDWLESEYLKAHINNTQFDSIEIKAAIVSLFLSMIPLHSENPVRQRSLFARGLQLYSRFFDPHFELA